MYMLPLIAPYGNYYPASSPPSDVASSGGKIVKTVNSLGQEVQYIHGINQFYTFCDRTTKKVFSTNPKYSRRQTRLFDGFGIPIAQSPLQKEHDYCK